MKGICNSNMLTKYIEEVDKDGDGEIDFDEFQEMMANCQI